MTSLVRQLLIAAAALMATAAPAAATDVHAHRGGALKSGMPLAPENSLSAFRSAHRRGASVVELDVHVSKDHVPFVMHDATLERTTDCSGPVADQTARQVGKCHIDIVGTNDAFRRAPGSKERVPRLAAVLRWAKKRGARLNVEINHYPTEPSFDPTSRFVTAELDAIAASHIPKRLILIQSFLPANLAPARKRGYKTALITFSGSNGQALAIARSEGIPVIEPQWPVDRAFVKRAHAAGRKVIPYTLGKRSELRAAAAAGVDGVISDDPTRARRTLRCFGAGRRYRAARRELAAAQRALKNAKDPAAKRRAAARVKTAQRKVGKTRRARRRACA